MPSRSWTICVTCRKAWRGSPTCKHETLTMHSSYRVPKRNNHKAWKRIAAGDFLWEKSMTDVHEREQANALFESRRNPMKDNWKWARWWAGFSPDFWTHTKRRDNA